MPAQLQWIFDNHSLVIGYATEGIAALTVLHHSLAAAASKMLAFSKTTSDVRDDAAAGFITSVVFYLGVAVETMSSLLPVARIGLGKKKPKA